MRSAHGYCVSLNNSLRYDADFSFSSFLSAMYEQCTQQDNYGCKKEGKYGFIQPIMSGRIRTKKRFSFRFGRLEVFAKMAAGDWMWPGGLSFFIIPHVKIPDSGWSRAID